jgi:hypothetical protein
MTDGSPEHDAAAELPGAGEEVGVDGDSLVPSFVRRPVASF